MLGARNSEADGVQYDGILPSVCMCVCKYKRRVLLCINRACRGAIRGGHVYIDDVCDKSEKIFKTRFRRAENVYPGVPHADSVNLLQRVWMRVVS